MGVKQYLYHIKTVYSRSIIQDKLDIDLNTTAILIDGNCIIHQAIEELLFTDITSKLIGKKTVEIIKSYIDNYNHAYIVFDGIPPKPKQHCQKERRQRSLIESTSHEISGFIIAGTSEMKNIEQYIIKKLQSDNVFINSSLNKGEGEQKMMKIIKDIYNNFNTFKVISVDSDVLILLQLILENFNDKSTKNIYYYTSMFNMCIDVPKLNTLMKKKCNALSDKLIFWSIIAGNDFFKRLSELQDYSMLQIEQFVNHIVNMFCTPSVVYGTPSVVYGTPSVVDGTPSVVYGTPSVVYGTPSVVDGTVYDAKSKSDKTGNFIINFKDFNTLKKLFQQIINFTKLSTCNKENCSDENINKYINLIFWFYEYFNTNNYINCEPIDNIPCLKCICNYNMNIKFIDPIDIDHLDYVFGSIKFTRS